MNARIFIALLSCAFSPLCAAPYDLKLESSGRLVPLEDDTRPADLDSVAVNAAGTRLYVASVSSAGIFDITDPTAPRELGSFNAGFGVTYDIGLLNETTACIVGDYGLAVFNVTDPANPVQIGSNLALGSGGLRIAFRIRFSGTTAWITGMFGTKAVNLADPSAPAITGSAATGISYGVAFNGNIAYVAARTSGIRVLNIANPAAPVVMSTLPPAAAGVQTRDVVVHGGALYSADTFEGLRVFDIGNPSAPVEVKRIKPQSTDGSGPDRLHKWGNRLAVPIYEEGTVVYDVTSPLNPVFEGRALATPEEAEPFVELNGRPGSTSGGVWSAAGTGPLLIQIEGKQGMTVSTVGPAAALQRIASTTAGSEGLAMVKKGSILYMAAGEAGLKVIDAANPAAPVVLTTLDTAGYASGLALSGGLLAVGDGESGIALFNIANPAAPQPAGTLNTPGDAGPVAFASPTLLLAADRSIYVRDPFSLQLQEVIGGGLHLIDVSNSSAPSLLGTYTPEILEAATAQTPEIKGSILSVSVSGTTALASNGPKGTVVLNISNPAAPVKVAEIGIEQPDTLPEARDYWSSSHSLFLSPSRAVVGHGWGGWQIVDLSNPAQPSVEAFVPAAGRDTGFLLEGSKLYVPLGRNGIQVYNLNNPFQPILEGSSSVVTANGLVVLGDMVLSAGAAPYINPAETLVSLRFFDPATTPRFVNPVRLPGGSFQCGVLALPGTRWAVIHSDRTNNWQGPLTFLTGGKEPVTFTDPAAASAARRFYLLSPAGE